MNYLKRSAQYCYGMTYNEAMKLAFQFAIKLNKKYIPKSWIEKQSAGIDWMRDYMARRKTEISLRTPENTSIARATSFNRHNVST